MVIKVKKKNGGIVEYSATKVGNLFKTIGFTGGLLVKATSGVFKEAKRLTKGGVVSATDFEKVLVKTVSNTNKIAMDTTRKVTKRVLR